MDTSPAGVPTLRTSGSPQPTEEGDLVGRAGELDAVHGFLDEAAARGGALVLCGETGVGRTALLDAAERPGSPRRCHRAAKRRCRGPGRPGFRRSRRPPAADPARAPPARPPSAVGTRRGHRRDRWPAAGPAAGLHRDTRRPAGGRARPGTRAGGRRPAGHRPGQRDDAGLRRAAARGQPGGAARGRGPGRFHRPAGRARAAADRAPGRRRLRPPGQGPLPRAACAPRRRGRRRGRRESAGAARAGGGRGAGGVLRRRTWPAPAGAVRRPDPATACRDPARAPARRPRR